MAAQAIIVAQVIMAGLVPDTDFNDHFMAIKESLVEIDISAADTALVVTEDMVIYTAVAVIEGIVLGIAAVIEDIVLDIVEAIEAMAVDTEAVVIEAATVIREQILKSKRNHFYHQQNNIEIHFHSTNANKNEA